MEKFLLACVILLNSCSVAPVTDDKADFRQKHIEVIEIGIKTTIFSVEAIDEYIEIIKQERPNRPCSSMLKLFDFLLKQPGIETLLWPIYRKLLVKYKNANLEDKYYLCRKWYARCTDAMDDRVYEVKFGRPRPGLPIYEAEDPPPNLPNELPFH
uniref:Mos1 transposase HTH domain-containing protein n=1 Tax=Trichuris muris TaxID=70415 RepID=A0A5S6QND3_TRIMR